MKRPILIVSSTIDKHAYGPVCSILESRGFEPVVYRTDQVLNGASHFLVEVEQKRELSVIYDGTEITPQILGASWFRKPSNYDIGATHQDRARQVYINSEINYMHESIWSVYPDNIWLNSPNAIRNADRKLGQLLLAKEVGFTIPTTRIGSQWEDMDDLTQLNNEGRIIVKLIRGVISDGNKMKALYTKALTSQEITKLSDFTTPFPGIYQPFIEKTREWRVTVVGDNVFPAAIYTSEDATIDWRKKQTTELVEFKEERMPSGIAEKCISYLGKMGLKFGAFDFIENPEKGMVFLECNPNGQYGWLEESLGFPISRAIASELISIAKENT